MDQAGFISKLYKPSLRFLSEVLEHSLTVGRRTPHDFIRHFPPSTIMASLDEQPRLRSIFLTTLVGLREKTALRTPSADAGRLLQAALEEHDTDAEAITRTFDPDDRVRFLDARKLWGFLTEGEFWKVSRSKDAAGHKLAQAHLAYILDRALAHGLASHADIIEGITIDLLGEKLPRGELTKIIRRAIDVGRTGAAFKHSEIFEATPSLVLVDHIALTLIFDSVILPVARLAGYVDVAAPAVPNGRPDEKSEEKRKEMSLQKPSTPSETTLVSATPIVESAPKSTNPIGVVQPLADEPT
jgi:hypothetical protein